MKAMRGNNTSKISTLSKFMNSFSLFNETHKLDAHGTSHLLRIRLFSSFDGHRQSSRGYNDRNDDSDRGYGRDRGGFRGRGSSHDDGWSMRGGGGGGGRGQFGGRRSGESSRDYVSPGKRVDGFRGGDRGRDQFGGRNGEERCFGDRGERGDGFRGGDRGRDQFGGWSGEERGFGDRKERGDGFRGGDRGRAQFGGRNGEERGFGDRGGRGDGIRGGHIASERDFGDRGWKDDGFDDFDLEESRSMRGGDRQRGQLGGGNGEPDREYSAQGKRNYDFGKKIGSGRDRGDKKPSDDLFKSDDEGEGKKDYQPSVRELLDKPKKDESSEKEDSEFLEKFKLDGVGMEEEEKFKLDGAGKEEEGKEEGKKEEEKKEESPSSEVDTNLPPQEEKMKEPESADEIFKKMKKSGLIPNAVAMLDGLCKDGLVHDAMKLFGLMREKGSMPEVVVYTAVVEGFCKAQKLDDAKRIFKKMQANGIEPNAFSYTVLINGLYQGKRLEEAVDVCLEMLGIGYSPNVATFTGLVEEFCKEKGLDDARKVVKILKEKGIILDDKALRGHLDKAGLSSGPSPMVWEAIFGHKKTARGAV